jgi:signal transduction histidine kinase
MPAAEPTLAAAPPGPWREPFRRPTFTLVLAGLLALMVWGASEWSYQRASRSLDSLGARAQARQAMQLVLRRMLDAESAQRGYLITARREYLLPLDEVHSDIDRALALLHKHYDADPATAALARQLHDRSIEKLSELRETLALHDAGQHERWRELVLSDIGREKMAEARSAVEQLLVIEDARVRGERADIYRTLELSRLGVHVSTLLALIGLVFFLRQTAALHATERAHAADLKSERDTLERQVRQRTLELSELNHHLQDVREAERSQLARSLHDNLGSLLTAAKLDMARLRRAMAGGAAPADLEGRVKHLAQTIDQGIAFKRVLIEELSPSALHNLGLRPALEILVSDLKRRSGIEVQLDAADMTLGPAPRIVAYRVVEAALSNIERHAAVKVAQVVVREQTNDEGGHLVVQVRDGGVGFVPSAVPRTRHDLANLRYRVETLGGHLRVTSAPGRGTEVEAHIPLSPSQWSVLDGAGGESGYTSGRGDGLPSP